jgi:hypothetical protein
MAVRSNALLSALESVVRQHPKLSAGIAFQLGVAVGAFVKTARGKLIASRSGPGAAAKLIEAVPVLKSALPARTKKRKPASRKRKTPRRAAA